MLVNSANRIHGKETPSLNGSTRTPMELQIQLSCPRTPKLLFFGMMTDACIHLVSTSTLFLFELDRL